MPHIFDRVDVGRHGWPIDFFEPILYSPPGRQLLGVVGVIVLL